MGSDTADTPRGINRRAPYGPARFGRHRSPAGRSAEILSPRAPASQAASHRIILGCPAARSSTQRAWPTACSVLYGPHVKVNRGVNVWNTLTLFSGSSRACSGCSIFIGETAAGQGPSPLFYACFSTGVRPPFPRSCSGSSPVHPLSKRPSLNPLWRASVSSLRQKSFSSCWRCGWPSIAVLISGNPSTASSTRPRRHWGSQRWKTSSTSGPWGRKSSFPGHCSRRRPTSCSLACGGIPWVGRASSAKENSLPFSKATFWRPGFTARTISSWPSIRRRLSSH